MTTPVTWTAVPPAEIDDPFVRYAAAPDAIALGSPQGWALLTPWRRDGHWGGAAIVSPDATRIAESQALAHLTEVAGERDVVPEWFSTAPGRDLTAPAHLRLSPSQHWSFLWTDEPPPTITPAAPQPRLIELDDDTDADRIQRFGTTHNGSFEGFPGRGFATLWLALVDATTQGLIAVGALHELASGAPHLAGIVVHGSHRGHGHGAVITAELTRRAVREHGVATLGVNDGNDTALRLYERLGYRRTHPLHTRAVGTVERQTG